MSIASMMNTRSRRAFKQKPHPRDKSTVVSIFPQDIEVVMHTVMPGQFFIPKGTLENPSILIVGPSSWEKDIAIGNDDQPPIEIMEPSSQIANSIVNDYCRALVAFEPEVRPGLFWIPDCKFDDKGEPDPVKTMLWIKSEHKAMFEIADRQQRALWASLVRMGDVLWAQTNGNPLAITDMMKMAAETLGMKETKAWMGDFASFERRPCPACGTLLNPNYPICATCKFVVDSEKVKALGMKFVA